VKAWLAFALALLAAPAAAQEVAITFDDLPAHSTLPPGETRVGVAARIIGALADAWAPPTYGFVNGVQVEREPASAPVLRLWLAAGNRLGNHTWSHLRLEDAAAFEDDVIRNEVFLDGLLGPGGGRWLRYPYLAEGADADTRSEVRKFLASRGYRVASVTKSFDDYAWNEPHARCAARGDVAAIARLEASYLAAADASLSYSRDLSRRVTGREIPFVLLMHIGAFDARMLPRLLALYRERGVRLAPLEAVMSDPFYAPDLASAATLAPTTLEDAARAKRVAVPAKGWSIGELDKVCR
jgi:peptidoglycan/xylan/chitin deacetylase (PgdA/CDA1 family)